MNKDIDFTNIDLTQAPPTEEPARQHYFIAKCREYVRKERERLGRPLNGAVITFGCQMNARDSEKLAGILEAVGYRPADTEEADFVIYNTCTVRDNANQRVYGRLGQVGRFKKQMPHKKVALCGCMMQEAAAIEKIRTSYRFVDLIFGTHNIFKFAELLARMFETGSMIVDIWQETDRIVEDLPVERKYFFKSGVNIMFGCNNFCSYCIVPYVRGRERSRTPAEILAEIRRLVADGVVEVMLLGQNVNSYGQDTYDNASKRKAAIDDTPCEVADKTALTDDLNKDNPDKRSLDRNRLNKNNSNTDAINTDTMGVSEQLTDEVNCLSTDSLPVNFPELLRQIEQIEGLERIRFMTSHPKDLSDELIQVMKESPKICRHLHLPLQSGSTPILTAMNRQYTKEQYLALAAKIRREIPDIALTTDIIVGFPGETPADVDETIDVVKQVQFDNAFTFLYSKRTGTPAAALPDQVPPEQAKEDFDRLLRVVQETARIRTGQLTGQTLPALVEEVNGQDGTLLTARLSNNTTVHFPGSSALIGQIVTVELKECRGFYYFGNLA